MATNNTVLVIAKSITKLCSAPYTWMSPSSIILPYYHSISRDQLAWCSCVLRRPQTRVPFVLSTIFVFNCAFQFRSESVFTTLNLVLPRLGLGNITSYFTSVKLLHEANFLVNTPHSKKVKIVADAYVNSRCVCQFFISYVKVR